MNANNAEICRVGNLEADFQQIPLGHFFFFFFFFFFFSEIFTILIFNKFRLVIFFSEVSQYCCEIPIIQIQQRKERNIFLDKISKTNRFTIEIVEVRPILDRKFIYLFIYFYFFILFFFFFFFLFFFFFFFLINIWEQNTETEKTNG